MIGYQNNIASLTAQRRLGTAMNTLQRSRERLASGMRITRASDDAAGLAIAESLKADTRISTQAVRNVNDGISMLQIADGALESLTSVLTRGAELASQAANGVYNSRQRQPLHDEAAALVAELDRIASTTKFNGLNLLQSGYDPYAADKQAIINGLQSSWLAQSEALISTYYGLAGDGASLTVRFVQGDAQYLAAVSGTVGGDGKVNNQELIIDVLDFIPATLPNGGTAPYYNDRIIAHEMVHAIMGRTMNFAALPTWFIEGTAEFIHGADERLAADIAANGGGAAGRTAVVNQIDQAWTGSSLQYSSGYAAVRYLHNRIISAGGTGIRAVMDYLEANPSHDLNQALTNIPNGAYAGGLAGFYADFKGAGNGVTYISTMNLANADTGAIGGADADGGARPVTATSVVPDTNSPTQNPLTGFAEVWPTITVDAGVIEFAIGLRGQDTLRVTLTDISSSSLGISSVDLVNSPRAALDNFKSAIAELTKLRGTIGATQSRMEVIGSNLQVMGENFTQSESRIRDVDVAQEAGESVRTEILTQAATAILAQANIQPRIALDLLQAI